MKGILSGIRTSYYRSVNTTRAPVSHELPPAAGAGRSWCSRAEGASAPVYAMSHILVSHRLAPAAVRLSDAGKGGPAQETHNPRRRGRPAELSPLAGLAGAIRSPQYPARGSPTCVFARAWYSRARPGWPSLMWLAARRGTGRAHARGDNVNRLWRHRVERRLERGQALLSWPSSAARWYRPPSPVSPLTLLTSVRRAASRAATRVRANYMAFPDPNRRRIAGPCSRGKGPRAGVVQ